MNRMNSVEFMKNAGFRPGSRSTFVSAKVDKAIDAPFGHYWRGRPRRGGTDQLARLKQGPPNTKSVRPRAEQQASENKMER